MGSKSRTKGKTAELEVCAILREHGPFPEAERDLEQVRGHDNGRDIIGTPDFVIQVKRRARITPAVIHMGLIEALSSRNHVSEYAVCVHRSDRAPWRITMAIDELFRMTNYGEEFRVLYGNLVEMDFIRWCDLCSALAREETP